MERISNEIPGKKISIPQTLEETWANGSMKGFQNSVQQKGRDTPPRDKMTRHDRLRFFPLCLLLLFLFSAAVQSAAPETPKGKKKLSLHRAIMTKSADAVLKATRGFEGRDLELRMRRINAPENVLPKNLDYVSVEQATYLHCAVVARNNGQRKNE